MSAISVYSPTEGNIIICRTGDPHLLFLCLRDIVWELKLEIQLQIEHLVADAGGRGVGRCSCRGPFFPVIKKIVMVFSEQHNFYWKNRSGENRANYKLYSLLIWTWRRPFQRLKYIVKINQFLHKSSTFFSNINQVEDIVWHFKPFSSQA